jgi:hypothetical protein
MELGEPLRLGNKKVKAVAFRPDGRWLTVVNGGLTLWDTKLWHEDTLEQVRTLFCEAVVRVSESGLASASPAPC